MGQSFRSALEKIQRAQAYGWQQLVKWLCSLFFDGAELKRIDAAQLFRLILLRFFRIFREAKSWSLLSRPLRPC